MGGSCRGSGSRPCPNLNLNQHNNSSQPISTSTPTTSNIAMVHNQCQPQPQPHPTQQWFTTNSNLNLKHSNSSQPISTSTTTTFNTTMVHNRLQPQPTSINVNLNFKQGESISSPNEGCKANWKSACFKDTSYLRFICNSCTYMQFFKHIVYLEVMNFQRFSHHMPCVPVMMSISFNDPCIQAWRPPHLRDIVFVSIFVT